MAEYSMIDPDTCEYIHVHDIEDCLRSIRIRSKDNEDTIKNLRKENKKLKEKISNKCFKDEEIRNLQHKLEKLQNEHSRSFIISEDEEKAIENWKKEHDEKVHGLTTSELRMKAEGVAGGRYSYHFVPTALGTSGTIKCSCGAKFEFQHIG